MALTARLVFALTLAATLVARARPAAADPKVAEALFASGKEAMARGDVELACARFRESFRLDAAPGTLLNSGECEARRGRTATAWQAFRDAAALLAPGDFRIGYAEERAAALEPRVARVTLSLAQGAPAGARVWLDGTELGVASLGVALPVDAGAHLVAVRATDRVESRTTLSIDDGESRAIVVAAGPERAPTSRAAGQPPIARRTGAFVAFGVGAAGLAVGATTGLLAMGAASTYRDRCDATGCDAEGLDAASRGRSLALASTIAFATAAVGAGVGAYLLVTAPRSSSAARLTIAPTLAHRGGAVSLGGSF